MSTIFITAISMIIGFAAITLGYNFLHNVNKNGVFEIAAYRISEKIEKRNNRSLEPKKVKKCKFDRVLKTKNDAVHAVAPDFDDLRRLFSDSSTNVHNGLDAIEKSIREAEENKGDSAA